MNKNTTMLLFGLMCFMIGVAGVVAYSRYTSIQRENLVLKTQLTASASPTSQARVMAPTTQPTQSPTITATATPTPNAKGSISGTVGYPSEGIPALTVYAFKQGELSTYYQVSTPANKNIFTISDVPAGTYLVVAYPQNTSELAGGYTKAVPCGLLASCTDHSLIPVVVEAGKTASGVEVKDWYAPAGTFPAKP
jgi:hypothetical protein